MELVPLMNEARNSRGTDMKYQLQKKIQDILDQLSSYGVALSDLGMKARHIAVGRVN
jgi:hypothetical protein